MLQFFYVVVTWLHSSGNISNWNVFILLKERRKNRNVDSYVFLTDKYPVVSESFWRRKMHVIFLYFFIFFPVSFSYIYMRDFLWKKVIIFYFLIFFFQYDFNLKQSFIWNKIFIKHHYILKFWWNFEFIWGNLKIQQDIYRARNHVFIFLLNLQN